VNDLDALLRAIIFNPDEDTPRLVYADCLEEHGRHRRAEFIRLQCELHARCHGGPTPTPQDLVEMRPLLDREQEILRDAVRDTVAIADSPIPWWAVFNAPSRLFSHGPGGRLSGNAHRGFVPVVTGPTAAFLAEAGLIFGTQPVQGVRLTDRQTTTSHGAGFGLYDSKPVNHDAWRRLRACLPHELFRLLPPGNTDPEWHNLLAYDTREAALAALEVACLAYGREKSGIEWPQPQPHGAT
jgi:uncharacterized protein (TIGR02996 family)